MKIATAVLLLLSGAAVAQVSTPERSVTDPRSVVSLESASAMPVPIADLGVTRGTLGAAWSTDGQHVFVSTDLTGRFNIWKVPAMGGWPEQLTHSDEAQSMLVPSPDGETLLFHQDIGGNELYDIYAVPVAGGPVTNLTDTPDVREENAAFAPDGRRIAFYIKGAQEPAYGVAVMDLDTREVRRVVNATDPEQNWLVAGWMPDGDTLIVNRLRITLADASVWSVDRAGNRTPVTSLEPGAYAVASDVSPDGRLLAITSNEGTGQMHAGILDLETGETRWLAPTSWEQFSGHFSPDGRWMVTHTNEDGRVTVGLVDVRTGDERPIEFPPGINAEATSATPPFAAPTESFAQDSRRLLIRHSATNTPGDLWIADVGSGESRPLTRLSMASVNETALPASEIVTYRSFDDTLVSAVLTVPFNLDRDGSNAAVIVPHGGPTGQAGDTFNRIVAALASRGYVVIQPNFRGSTGYGIEFQTANVGDLGGGDLGDVLAARDFIIETGYVDPERVGITGGSYGGFMTLMAIGKAPDAFAAAVQWFGIINWFTMHETSDPLLQRYLVGLLGDPVENRDRYEASSPMTFIHQARAPLLSLQGENDVRVPRSQAEEVALLLRDQGVDVETVYYADEGHGFLKQENNLDAIRRTVEWFDERL